jgi:hypothetical protein
MRAALPRRSLGSCRAGSGDIELGIDRQKHSELAASLAEGRRLCVVSSHEIILLPRSPVMETRGDSRHHRVGEQPSNPTTPESRGVLAALIKTQRPKGRATRGRPNSRVISRHFAPAPALARPVGNHPFPDTGDSGTEMALLSG